MPEFLHHKEMHAAVDELGLANLVNANTTEDYQRLLPQNFRPDELIRGA